MATDQVIKDIASQLEKSGMAKTTFSLVAKLGMNFKTAPKLEWVELGPPKNCFENATLFAVGRNLAYVEGFIAVHGVPIHHAWCVNFQGDVIDPTIPDPERWEYFGIPMSIDFVLDTAEQTQMYGVLDNHKFRTIYELDPQEFVHPNWKK